jgi:DNA-binding YbaB/EbfC family protein
MKNLGQLMKQAQEMQAKLQQVQEKLAEATVTGSSGGGMVQVTLNGKGDMRSIRIDPALLSKDEKEVLEDLIVAACADAKGKVEAYVRDEMSKLTGGLNLPPGMSLPF